MNNQSIVQPNIEAIFIKNLLPFIITFKAGIDSFSSNYLDVAASFFSEIGGLNIPRFLKESLHYFLTLENDKLSSKNRKHYVKMIKFLLVGIKNENYFDDSDMRKLLSKTDSFLHPSRGSKLSDIQTENIIFILPELMTIALAYYARP